MAMAMASVVSTAAVSATVRFIRRGRVSACKQVGNNVRNSNGSSLRFRSSMASVARWNLVGAESSLHNYATSRFLSSAGRSRKRPRPKSAPKGGSAVSVHEVEDTNTKDRAVPDITPKPTVSSQDESLPYPKGKPWRVLWPRPHGVPDSPEPSLWEKLKGMPTTEQVRKGWVMYKKTWEDGITGISTKPKESPDNSIAEVGDSSSPSTEQQLREIGDNAATNLKIVRKDAQDLLEKTKQTTGIRTQDDLKALASEAMKIATECIREFMAGYRSGRDSEIDKMLHEYFQDEEEEEKHHGEQDEALPDVSKSASENVDKTSNTNETASVAPKTKRKKKRKPKRGIPRI